MVKANGGKVPEGTKNPPLRQWTQESSLLALAISELRQLRAVFIAVNGGKNGPIEPVPTPETALSRRSSQGRVERKLSVHDRLVAKLLGDRAKKK